MRRSDANVPMDHSKGQVGLARTQGMQANIPIDGLLFVIQTQVAFFVSNPCMNQKA